MFYSMIINIATFYNYAPPPSLHTLASAAAVSAAVGGDGGERSRRDLIFRVLTCLAWLWLDV